MSDDAAEILEQINAPVLVEKTRPSVPWLCGVQGHQWGYSLESYSRPTTTSTKVCVRKRGSVRGRCPAEKWSQTPDVESQEAPPAATTGLFDGSGRPMGFPRALRLDWGAPLERRIADEMPQDWHE